MRGMPAVYIKPAENKEGKEYSFSELHAELNDTFEALNIQFKYIVIDTLTSEFGEDELGELVQFIDWAITNGIHIAYNVDGAIRPSYLRMGGFVRAFIADDTWLGYPVNEIFWEPHNTETEEPTLSEHANIPRFIVVSEQFTLKDAVTFLLQKAVKTWVLNIPVKQNIKEKI